MRLKSRHVQVLVSLALVLAVVAPACLGGLIAVVRAAVTFALAAHPARTLAGIVVLLLASMLAQRYPVPVYGLDTREINLGFVFGVVGVVLFGWAGGVLIAAGSPPSARSSSTASTCCS